VFRINETMTYRMPPHFGEAACNPTNNQQYDDVTGLVIRYLTDRDKLEQYIPEDFKLIEPEVGIYMSKCRGVQWMSGGYYNLIMCAAPVQYLKAKEPMYGMYALVVWEDKTAPILGGREETGVPKVFADISDFYEYGPFVTTHASHEGRCFLELEFTKEGELTEADISEANKDDAPLNQFGWRYIPNIGKPGAALSEIVVYPQQKTTLSGWKGTGKITWTPINPAFHPAQFHIIDAMATLPIREYRQARFTKQINNLRGDLARTLP
jgi:acetoacetate decarboxylase